MKVNALKKLLHTIIDDGYGDWKVFFCDDDNDDYTVNHIFLDDDGDVCLQSTDTEGDNYDFTVKDVLARLKRYNNEKIVYFQEEYWDGGSEDYDIEFNWYIGTDNYGDSILNIDCTVMEEENWYSGDDEYDVIPKFIDCPNCTGRAKWDGEFYRCKTCGFCGDSSYSD